MTQPSTHPSTNEDWNRPNAETLEALAEMDDMIRHGTGKEFHSVAELFEDLNS